MPTVTVLMAVRNPPAAYLRQAVESVLAQTFTDFELLIVEDPSEASTAELLSCIDDPRLRIHRNDTNLGLSRSLNVGLGLARGALVARFDADDVCLPQRLERQVAFLAEHPDVDVYGSRIIVIDENGRRIARRDLPLTHEAIARRLRITNGLSHPSVMFRKASVDAFGGYEPGQVVEDFELWCRMVSRGARFAASEEPLILYRFHPAALKFALVRPTIASMIEIKRRYFRRQLNLADHLRLLIERILLLLPPALVVKLFKWVEYRGLSAAPGREC